MEDNLNRFTQNEKFLMLALDHRGSFKELMGSSVTDEEIVRAKQQIIKALYDEMSGVLIDPEWGLKAYQNYTQEGNVEAPKPYLLSIEKTGYTEEKGEKVTELEYTVSQLKELGASGVKLLLYINPDVQSFSAQLETARKVLLDCKTNGLPLFLEFVTYSMEENAVKSELIIESVRKFVEAGVVADVFKLEYPGDENSCKAITQILGQTPWILLTRGGDFDTFKNNLQTASENGATGFLAGRSVWQEFTKYQGDARKKFLEETVRERFLEIAKIANQ